MERERNNGKKKETFKVGMEVQGIVIGSGELIEGEVISLLANVAVVKAIGKAPVVIKKCSTMCLEGLNNPITQRFENVI
ncbi:hypothetical protein [Enterococcus mundtii]|uniref:hypothetical protein n=1 Tax=Enterococcus mundtii TaxID=53346 RepID=UPI0013789E4A|nr:hypothetical protein [Enterococcus mundtii]NBA63194.1 hypothetical protein [Enterococcus mundtii]